MTREEVLRRICKAFPDSVWPKERLAAIEDSGDLDCRYIIEHYQGKRWTEPTRKELGWASQDGWAFNEDALVFFFPAWLASDVGDPDHAWQVETIAGYMPSRLTNRFTAEQRLVALQAIEWVYEDEVRAENEGDPLNRLVHALSLTMTITNTPRGRMIVGDVDEVQAFLNEEWKAMPPQEKAELFVDLMREWRPDAPGLARTARLVKFP